MFLRNKKNASIIAIVLIAIIGLIYAGCSKSADINMQTTPETNQVMSTMDVQSTVIDCENWTWEELNAWAKPIAQTLDCRAFNEMVRTNECFKIWFNELHKREIEAGNVTIIEKKEFHADEHTTGPNCGVVDYGNDNCFNGDFEKLDAWVQKIIDRGNEKEIMNKMNHNPCVRLWLREMGLLNDIVINKIITTNWVYIVELWQNCPSSMCSGGCTVSWTEVTFMDTETGNTWTENSNGKIVCN